ncbi:MAG: DNA replication/repair protein RecF [Clostridia bacterium]|jgi:DNA replication and repair protein RecF|uniref:DNA replication/repair protein RecF n=1 Tax=Pumilibacter muris TaxID=2941510 RepID=UPI0020410FFF|nr:DNA replication/repair protein RecF [Pumilibacter muris]MCI8596538.1 DNA replication/repair protein RecF [Clostridia bacterium]
MIVLSAELNDYRNYGQTRVEFGGGINVLCGDNAQGKTNLLEAVYLCSVGRSPRTPRDKELIKKGCERGRIKLTQEDRGGSNTVEILLDRVENKRVAINGMPITRMGELMGVVAAVYFSPDEMRIIKDAPGDRRRFMDIALCRMSKAYFYLLGRYNKILAQRNRLLKSGKATDDVLDVWDAQLASEGAKIAKTRRGYVERLSKYAKEAHEFLSDGKESLCLEYEGFEGNDAQEAEKNFAAELKKNRERDRQFCFTSCGVQKDDIAVKVGEVDVRAYGSQGQQRTAALSLKLSEMEMHYAQSGEYPALLLDDVLSELDPCRQRKLIERSKKYQTIITCTHLPAEIESALGEYSLFSVKSGTVTTVDKP